MGAAGAGPVLIDPVLSDLVHPARSGPSIRVRHLGMGLPVTRCASRRLVAPELQPTPVPRRPRWR